MEIIPLLHAAATLLMAGLIWFVQIVHYPLMQLVAAGQFATYEREHQRRTTWVVAPLMLVEAATAVLLCWFSPATLLAVVGVVALLLIWASTFLVQVPCHSRLADNFTSQVHQRLVQSNWLRTILWSFRGVLAICLLGSVS